MVLTQCGLLKAKVLGVYSKRSTRSAIPNGVRGHLSRHEELTYISRHSLLDSLITCFLYPYTCLKRIRASSSLMTPLSSQIGNWALVFIPAFEYFPMSCPWSFT